LVHFNLEDRATSATDLLGERIASRSLVEGLSGLLDVGEESLGEMMRVRNDMRHESEELLLDAMLQAQCSVSLRFYY
jgi:hypothetical protein